MTNVEALKNLYVAKGGAYDDVANLTTSADVINAIAGYEGIKDTGVQAEKSTATLFDTKVSAMQTGVNVADGAITGTLKFIQGGLSPAGPLSGDGNFLALKFIDNNDADSIKVGLVPSAGTGFVELIGDPDMNGVCKVAGEIEGVQQVLKVITTVGSIVKTQTFDLSGLILETE